MLLIQHLGNEDDILNEFVENKTAELLIENDKINIIIAGDSRAEWQLSPKIIKENTGFNTINIAADACDLVTTVAAIKKKYKSCPKNIFVISVSSWQINDGAIDPGSLSLKCFQELTLIEKLKLYRRNLLEMIRMEVQLSESYEKAMVRSKREPIQIKEGGFHGIDGNLLKKFKVEDIERKIPLHPWYKNIQNEGARWLLFQRALKDLGKMNSSVIIYQPPVSPIWRKKTTGSVIDHAEVEYSRKISNEIKKYKNIYFLDFYNNDIKLLNDTLYSDIQHLNSKGAEVFSSYLSNQISEVCKGKFKDKDQSISKN
jgi:hypothetical protein